MERKRIRKICIAIIFLLGAACIFMSCLEQPSIVTVIDKSEKAVPEPEPEIIPEPEPEPDPEPEPEIVPEPDPEPQPEPEPEVSKKLTLMVYMAADNDLESYALQNLKQLEQTVTDDLNILVLLDRADGYDETDGNWTDTRFFEVCRDDTGVGLLVSKRISCLSLGLSSSINTELDMANPNVLRKFVEYGIKSYKADKYALIIWGHGTGWRYVSNKSSECRAVAIDDKTGSYMRVSDLGKALRGQGLNVIGFDTCFGGVLENVYELRECADYTVACPGITPSAGWNYSGLIENLFEENSGAQDVQLTSQKIAAAMTASSCVESSVFINQNLSVFMSCFEAFSHALSSTIKTTSDKTRVLRELMDLKSYSYIQYPCDLYLDIFALAEKYKSSSDAQLKEAAENLLVVAGQTVLPGSAAATPGIGVHLIPLMASHTTSTTHSFDYLKNPNNQNQCDFIKESQWWVPTIEGKSGSLLDKLFYNGE